MQAYLSRSKSQYYSTKTFGILRFCHRQVLQYKPILTYKAGTQMRTQQLQADYNRRDSISMEHNKENKIKKHDCLLGCDSKQSVSSCTNKLNLLKQLNVRY